MLRATLSRLYNTAYFYKSIVVDINYLFSTVQRLLAGEDYVPNIGNEELGKIYAAAKAGEQIEFDLAGAKLTADACQSILLAQHNGLLFCDSVDENRNEILMTNRKRMAMDKSGYVQLPPYTYKDNLKEYIYTLNTTDTYTVFGPSEKLSVAIACLITLIRPEVKLDIDSITGVLFKFIATKVSNTTLIDDTEFWVYTDFGVVEVSDDKNVYIQEIGERVSVKEAVQYGIVVPKKFGTEMLATQKEWLQLFKSCCLIIEEYRESCPKTLTELYGV